VPEGQNNVSHDVLVEHHKRNRAPRAPDPIKLNTIRQARGPSVVNTSNQGQPETDSEQTRPRAKRHSKTPYGGRSAKPTQMQFYPSQWRDILECSKWGFRLWLVIYNPFPDRTEHIGEAEDCIDEALALHQAKGKRVEPGTRLEMWHQPTLMLCLIGYLEDHVNDMRTLVSDLLILPQPGH
jgi:hypothetical protein